MKTIPKKVAGSVSLIFTILFILTISPAMADSSSSYGQPDTERQGMFSGGLPMREIYIATVRNVVNNTPKGKLANAQKCMSKFISAQTQTEVAAVLLAAHPGSLFATTKYALHASPAGQKMLFFCSAQMKAVSPTVVSELNKTMNRYLQIAFRDTGHKVN